MKCRIIINNITISNILKFKISILTHIAIIIQTIQIFISKDNYIFTLTMGVVRQGARRLTVSVSH